jgi:hypothetical protein
MRDANLMLFIKFWKMEYQVDQGPEVVMIKNYRTGLLWDLFMSYPEIKNGLRKLGFTAKQITGLFNLFGIL